MSLTWETVSNDNSESIIFQANSLVDADSNEGVDLSAAIDECIEKSVAQMPENINDDSMFMLFEWSGVESLLTVVVTDHDKKHDSKVAITCQFSALQAKLEGLKAKEDGSWQKELDRYSDEIEFWIRDCLSSCTGFMRFSLIAAFHKETRSKSILL